MLTLRQQTQRPRSQGVRIQASDAAAGTATGTSNAAYAGAEAQRRYDIAYQQCMYAKGNQLPGYGYRAPAPAAAGGVPHYYPPPPPAPALPPR